MSVQSRFWKVLPLILGLVPGVTVSCGDAESDAPPGHYTLNDFQSLQWLEGDWEGSGGQRPFFEGYESVNDSTIRIHYYADSTLSKDRGTGSVYLSKGVIFHTADDGTWVAARFDSTGIYFVPHENAENSFRWRILSPDTWEAILRFKGGSEARYVMSRIKK
jgi:hypothetical protein